MVLTGSHRQYVFAVGHNDEAGLFTVKELLDHDAVAGFTECVAGEHVAYRLLGAVQVRRDDHAFSGGETVGLDHDGYASVLHVGECRVDLGEGAILGGRDVMAGEKVLRERL